ncbi:glycoside hydrolase family 25 protein [Oceanirhabdus sp. W0125-5]|uniref:glycoside hydrolase family 25 protein n=1 Tax=Oceanirhabdus sp. W0125-5 TaxID=2999116 RepID=UPI0022F337C6|nr:glycoside hydrolase family 25 protein [Oceanirhabdus sp. W0125-5]WBW97869.1 glycoside hydrolase family 25 protein [Oceanirhabdus sp. W0125-5]
MQNKTSKSLFGVDLNQYRANADFKILATKCDFIFLRSSGSGTGKFKVDTKFLELAKKCRDFGIPSSAYHFAVPSADLSTADSQCDDFINILQEGYGKGNYGELFPVVDVEVPLDKSISTDNLLDWIDRFRRRFESKTRRRLMLYTGAFFIEMYNNFKHSKKGYILSDMPLWIAMYTDIPTNPPFPNDAGGWTRWRVWQFSEKGKVAGIDLPVDVNWGPDHIDLLRMPKPVSNVKATIHGGMAKVTWNKSTDIDLNGYNLFVNKEYITTLDKNAVAYNIDLRKVPRLKAGMEVVVGIESFDLDGEFSKRVEVKAGTRDNEMEPEERIQLEDQMEFQEFRYDSKEDEEEETFFIRYPKGWRL